MIGKLDFNDLVQFRIFLEFRKFVYLPSEKELFDTQMDLVRLRLISS